MSGPRALTAEEITWMLEHADDNRVPNFIACATINGVIATTCIVLRLWSRCIQQHRLHLITSDWLAVAAWVAFVGCVISSCLSTRYGLGRHVIFASDLRLFCITNIIYQDLYVLVTTLLKLSILSLYKVIFGPTRWFNRTIWVVSALVIEMGIQYLLTINLECIPLAKLWNRALPGTCIRSDITGRVGYTQNIISDIVLLSMPIPLIRGLQISKRRKWALILAFGAGGSTCIVCIIQLKFFGGLNGRVDYTWDLMGLNYLGLVECMTGFVATSIAVYGPLYQRIFKTPVPSSQRTSLVV
ncbi:hypothetical protein F4774DRAFT_210318 [Daldinia eschscholtzii]|nr:hypothetical protein F4774DRAFT_210318 [Daldinia eschscholtzii]